MAQRKHLPKIDRIGTLAASIMLAYFLARVIRIPSLDLTLSLPGALLDLHFSITTVVAFFVIGLTATGVDWLLREHPALRGRTTFQHWLLPALTAWAVGAALLRQPLGPVWWVGFALGSALLMLVVIAEYITIDPQDLRRPPAAITLTAVAYALYLVLIMLARLRGVRLFLTVPLVTLASALVGLRLLLLQFPQRGVWRATAVIALICAQVSTALYYLPLSPMAFALALVGLLYSLVTLAESIIQQQRGLRVALEPILVLAFTWALAITLR